MYEMGVVALHQTYTVQTRPLHTTLSPGAMTDQRPTTETMRISDVRGQLNKLVNRVYRKETRVVVEKSGIPA